MRPKVLKNKQVKGTARPRQALLKERPPAVLRISNSDHYWTAVESAWQQLWANWFKGQSILVKINLNSADPYPASTCPVFLREFLHFLQKSGAGEILVGDCSAVNSLPTRRVARRIGLDVAVAGLASLVFFDELEWVEVAIPGQYLDKVTVPGLLYEVDRVINLTNLKTHCLADYSLALKAAVGYMHPLERISMHKDNLQQKTVEINLAVMADLTVIDGRMAMISGGPARGATCPADLLLIGDHPAAVDYQAYQELYRLKQQHNCLEHFRENPLDMPQLEHAARVWPVNDWQQYHLLQY
jgi:uncharacterized protein (DUF362 family)